MVSLGDVDKFVTNSKTSLCFAAFHKIVILFGKGCYIIIKMRLGTKTEKQITSSFAKEM